MNPLNGMTLDKIQADTLVQKINQEAQYILSNIRYSIDIKRFYFLTSHIHNENIDLLFKNGFQVHEISVFSKLYNSTIHYYVVYWDKLDNIKTNIESLYPECCIEWHS